MRSRRSVYTFSLIVVVGAYWNALDCDVLVLPEIMVAVPRSARTRPNRREDRFALSDRVGITVGLTGLLH